MYVCLSRVLFQIQKHLNSNANKPVCFRICRNTFFLWIFRGYQQNLCSSKYHFVHTSVLLNNAGTHTHGVAHSLRESKSDMWYRPVAVPQWGCRLCKQSHSAWVIKPWFAFILGRYKQLRRGACVRVINHSWKWGNKKHMGQGRTTETAQPPAWNTADDGSSCVLVRSSSIPALSIGVLQTCWEDHIFTFSSGTISYWIC